MPQRLYYVLQDNELQSGPERGAPFDTYIKVADITCVVPHLVMDARLLASPHILLSMLCSYSLCIVCVCVCVCVFA